LWLRAKEEVSGKELAQPVELYLHRTDIFADDAVLSAERKSDA
jgi:hypothetical protein